MSVNLFAHPHSESDLRATIAALKVSKLLFRKPRDFSSSVQAVTELLSKSFAGALAVEAVAPDQDPLQWTQGDFNVDQSMLYFAEHQSPKLQVRVWLSAPGYEGEPGLQILTEYVAQQIATFAETHALADANRALRLQIKIEQESLALRKIMDRAKAIITSRGPLSPQQAEEFLIASSVRTGRPLMKVAGEIVLAYGLPQASFNQRSPRNRLRSQNWNKAVA